ncbi:MAG TPA: fused MFS/spermidine synthase [Planctomycetota bacterium]|nr:fused MFS/spermidine synthase [Planctomycetota bacterium]
MVERPGGKEVPRRRGTLGWLLLCACAGAATLVVELAAVRLLAPWFGASSGVWTNVIGVILLALALGYLVGARLAARPRPERALGIVLLAAGLASLWTPALAAPVCSAFLPAGLSLHQAAGLWLWGSLAASLCLFLPQALLLGTVGPLAVELVAVRRGGHAGSAGGRVLCASTLGSLAGTFATTHVLVPRLGLQASFVLAGLVLLVLGAAALLVESRSRTALLGALVVAAFAAPSVGGGGALRRPAPGAGMRVRAERESPYQYLRVVDDESWNEPLRLLQVNEGLDSYQSVWQAQPGLLGPGFYYDLFALPLFLGDARGPWRTLVLGLGAGTAFRVLEGVAPEGLALELSGVELDPVVIELAREHFELDSSAHTVLGGRDARLALRSVEPGLDCVLLDAYANQVEIPAHLCSVEFFGEVREKLAPGGWIAVNAGGFGSDDPVIRALGHTLARAFGSALALRVPRARNWVLFARREAALPRPGDDGSCVGAAWEIEGDVPAALLAPLRVPGSAAWFADDPDARVLTDDLNPMDFLQRRSLQEGLERLRAAS